MSFKTNIINRILDIPSAEIIALHQEVISSINRISELIPSKYNIYNLEKIIMPKAYGYHTILDTSYYQYHSIKRLIKKSLRSEKISGQLSYKLLQMKKYGIDRAVRDFKNEIPIDFAINNYSFNNYKDKSYNLFFTGTQTYLRVLILYINQSKLNNNLLVIPRFLSKVEVLNDFDNNKLLFYEDFLNEDILNNYNNAKNEFSLIFKEKRKYLKEIFLLDSKNFFKIINIGLENIFNYLLPQALLFSLINENIYNKINVNNVIGARVRKIYDRASYEIAKKYNINRYVVLHSNIGTDIKFIHSMGHFNNLTGVFTWGLLQKKLIERDFFSKVDNIFVTGSPLFEKSYKNINNNSKYDRCILYAATHNDLQEVKELVKITNSLPRTTSLIIKVHPDIDHKPYEKYIQSEHVKLVPGESSLENLLPQVDLLVTTISESALQAMIRGVPALFFLFTERWKKLGYNLYGFDNNEEEQLVINSKESLKKRINELLFSEKYRSVFLKNQNNFLNKRIRMHSDNNGAANEIDKILN